MGLVGLAGGAAGRRSSRRCQGDRRRAASRPPAPSGTPAGSPSPSPARAAPTPTRTPSAPWSASTRCLDYSRAHRLSFFEAAAIREIAGLEAVLAEPDIALELFDAAVEVYHRAGNHGSAATTLADLAVLLGRIDRPEIGATVYGISTRSGISLVANLGEALDRIRTALGDSALRAMRERPARRCRSTRRWRTSAARSPWPDVSSPRRREWSMARIVVHSMAYRGDVFPYVPIASELARRGHDVTFVVPA